MTRPATEVLDLDTPLGPARCHVDTASSPQRPTGGGPQQASEGALTAETTLVLGHGAGGGVNAADLELLARGLPPLGVTVVRFEQPWRVAGRRVAVPPPQLDIGWRAAVTWLRGSGRAGSRLFIGGRSAGARVACRTANDFGVAGVVCLAFPLHLPGRPESRLPELLQPQAPRLVLQGSQDSFGGAAELTGALQQAERETRPAGGPANVRVIELPGADHGFRVAKSSSFSPADLRGTVLAEVASFVVPT